MGSGRGPALLSSLGWPSRVEGTHCLSQDRMPKVRERVCVRVCVYITRGLYWGSEWSSGPRHCISVQEVSVQSLVQIQAESHLAGIGSPMGGVHLAQRHPGLVGVGSHCK